MSTYSIPISIAAKAHIDKTTYESMYEQSVKDPRYFLGQAGQRFFNMAEVMV